MKRSRILLSLVGVLAVLAAGGLAIYLAGQQTPSFYTAAIEDSSPSEVRQKAVEQLVRETTRMAEEIQHAPVWSAEFTDTQVNAWLIDELPHSFPQAIPPEVRDPRIKFELNRILVGFRYNGPRDG